MEYAVGRWWPFEGHAGPFQCGRPPWFKKDRMPLSRGRERLIEYRLE
nr:MAG TPA: hypothetical protein [Caudoviricetes sp.]